MLSAIVEQVDGDCYFVFGAVEADVCKQILHSFVLHFAQILVNSLVCVELFESLIDLIQRYHFLNLGT